MEWPLETSDYLKENPFNKQWNEWVQWKGLDTALELPGHCFNTDSVMQWVYGADRGGEQAGGRAGEGDLRFKDLKGRKVLKVFKVSNLKILS